MASGLVFFFWHFFQKKSEMAFLFTLMLFKYKKMNEEEIEITDITTKDRHVHIPDVIYGANLIETYIVSINKDTLRYLSGTYLELHCEFVQTILHDSIDFDKSSEIELIYSIFISRFKHFHFPPNLKRIVFDSGIGQSLTTLHQESPNKYIILEKREKSQLLRHNFPHELNMYKSSRKTVFIRKTTKIIGNFAFMDDKIIVKVVIPVSVEVIGRRCFDNCANLRLVVIPEKTRISIIGSFAFHRTSIRSIIIPASVETIEYYAFFECLRLRKVILQKNSKLKKIQTGAFDKCVNLKDRNFENYLRP